MALLLISIWFKIKNHFYMFNKYLKWHENIIVVILPLGIHWISLYLCLKTTSPYPFTCKSKHCVWRRYRGDRGELWFCSQLSNRPCICNSALFYWPTPWDVAGSTGSLSPSHFLQVITFLILLHQPMRFNYFSFSRNSLSSLTLPSYMLLFVFY